MNSKFTFETQGTHTYLVYAVAEEDALDSMSLGMLTNNKIQGLAHTLFTQMDATKFIKYDVSAKISVKQFFTGQVNKKRLLGVFNGIVDAMLSAEDYMLDVNSIILDLDCIFTDVSTCETVLICLPVISDDLSSSDFGTFFKNIMFTTQFDQTENCDHVAKIINFLNGSPIFSLEEFKKLLDSFNDVVVPAQVVQQSQQVIQTQQTVQQAQQVIQTQQTVQQTVQERVQNTQQEKTSLLQQEAKKVTNIPHKKEETSFGGMQIPGAKTTPDKTASVAPAADEKPMSWFYLMQHYNAENAAIYKAQQDAKKAKKTGSQPVASVAPTKPAKKTATSAPNTGFAIPGQTQEGFAIPGQQTMAAQPEKQQASQTVSVKPEAAMQQRFEQQAVQQTAQQNVQQQTVQQSVQQVSSGTPLNFGETTVLSAGMGETTVLSAATQQVKNDPHLIRTKNNEKIPLNKPVFRIGKERSYVDYFISDNTAISRGHANIVNHGGEFFVVDTNSTNHTYVNGGMIQSGVETKLSHGTKIRLANEDFEFKLY